MRPWKSLLTLAVFAAMTGTAAAQAIGMGVGAAGFWTNSAGAAIAKVANDAGVKMRIQPFTGTTVYVPSIDNGQLEFGLANHLESYQAVHGVGLWGGKKLDNIRVVTVISPLRVTLFVKKDSPIKRVSDLKGKRVTTDYSAQKIVQLLVEGTLSSGGLTMNDIEQVKVPNVVRGATDFAAGKADAFFFALGAGKVAETDAAVGGIRALGIDPSPGALQRLQKYIPVGYGDLVQPAPHLPGVVGPTRILAYDYLALAGKDTPAELVYQVTKAMHGGKAGLAAAFKPLAEFDPAKMAKELGKGLEYHPGAIKFYREIGAWPAKSS